MRGQITVFRFKNGDSEKWMLLRIAPSLRYHNDVFFTEGMAWPIGSEENNLSQGPQLALPGVDTSSPVCRFQKAGMYSGSR